METKRYGYLTLQEDIVKKHRNSAKVESEANGFEDKNHLTFSEDVWFKPDEVVVENGKLTVTGEIYIGKDELAYVSVEVPITVDVAQDIVSVYLKQLNRLKTILEVANAEQE